MLSWVEKVTNSQVLRWVETVKNSKCRLTGEHGSSSDKVLPGSKAAD